jgi:ferredoxin
MATRTAVDVRTSVVEAEEFGKLLTALRRRGYLVKGPVLRHGAIVYDDLESVDDMPIGWSDTPEPARYRLRKRDDRSLFGYTVGPTPWKNILHPPRTELWKAERSAGGFKIERSPEPAEPLALVGVRACDLAALHLLDQVLLAGPYADPIYAARRSKTFIVAVNCTRAAATCFCAATHTGPAVGPGADLVLTELLQARRHCLVVSAQTERGAALMADVPHEPATERDMAQVTALMERVRREAGPNRISMTDLRETLLASYDLPIWEEVATRCLTCGNCTNVCPTCFCTSVSDTTDIMGAHAERTRVSDSCFTMAYSYATGGSVRYTAAARYRQWLLHKFATWTDQFGSPGCVGCGRCLTWCPVGIDVTDVVSRIRRSSHGRKEISDANVVR